ncbi:hypothetical protein EDD86DRAFT_232157 [Gorgonomyces haynaldii]|nr:hypothetical protein EDD86DRAFT_232157 [Gorgonomyces haynaldii]
MIQTRWEQSTDGQRLAIGIIAVNTVVFGLWQIPTMSRFMTKHFLHIPSSGKSYTLFTSTFSHSGGLHFLFNMFGLWSFFGPWQFRGGYTPEHAAAFYLGAAGFSALGSHFSSLVRPFHGSLGASGALFGVFAAYAVDNPHAQVGIVFLPGIRFTLEQLLPALVLFDLAGFLLRWRGLDHAAHLSGVAFGFLYANYGRPLWNQVQRDRMIAKKQ